MTNYRSFGESISWVLLRLGDSTTLVEALRLAKQASKQGKQGKQEAQSRLLLGARR